MALFSGLLTNGVFSAGQPLFDAAHQVGNRYFQTQIPTIPEMFAAYRRGLMSAKETMIGTCLNGAYWLAPGHGKHPVSGQDDKTASNWWNRVFQAGHNVPTPFELGQL